MKYMKLHLDKYKKVFFVFLIAVICMAFPGCDKGNWSSDYTAYPNVNTADDYFKQCFNMLEGDWHNDDRTISFYIENDKYRMSGWSDRSRIIIFYNPIKDEENQFRIGIEAGELQEVLTCEIVEEDAVIHINDVEYVR